MRELTSCELEATKRLVEYVKRGIELSGLHPKPLLLRANLIRTSGYCARTKAAARKRFAEQDAGD